MSFTLPDDAVEESFLAGTGPGGQNVNKVATACQLRVNIFALGLSPAIWRRLKTLAGSRLNSAGELIITARTSRSREANRQEARDRAVELIEQAHIQPRRRVATRPSKAAKAKRVDTKKGRATVKKNRAKPRLD